MDDCGFDYNQLGMDNGTRTRSGSKTKRAMMSMVRRLLLLYRREPAVKTNVQVRFLLLSWATSRLSRAQNKLNMLHIAVADRTRINAARLNIPYLARTIIYLTPKCQHLRCL